MEVHKTFTEWAIARGVKINGIATHNFPGRGLGIIAEEKLKAGDVILIAPISVLRTAQTVPKSISKAISTISVNGLLAAELALDTSEASAPWRAVLPTKDYFEESMPLMWHSSLQALLPLASLALVAAQRRKLSSDWTAVSIAFPQLSYDIYLYNWFLVSTRTFYYVSPNPRPGKPLSHDDCLALIPFADNFNHADVGCEVTYSPSGYQVSAYREIEKGEEIYISYGNHSNDFLLVEYGFILAENRWDEIFLDEMILRRFSEEQKQHLKDVGFLGKYALDKDTVCYRTQVALRLLYMPFNRWQRLVANGLEANDNKYQKAVDGVLLKTLQSYLVRADQKLNQVKLLDRGLDSQKKILSRRWEQIRSLLMGSIDRINGKS